MENAEMWTPKECGKYMRWSMPTLYRWMKTPGFPVVRAGRNCRIPAKQFKEWVVAQAAKAND